MALSDSAFLKSGSCRLLQGGSPDNRRNTAPQGDSQWHRVVRSLGLAVCGGLEPSSLGARCLWGTEAKLPGGSLSVGDWSQAALWWLCFLHHIPLHQQSLFLMEKMSKYGWLGCPPPRHSCRVFA